MAVDVYIIKFCNYIFGLNAQKNVSGITKEIFPEMNLENQTNTWTMSFLCGLSKTNYISFVLWWTSLQKCFPKKKNFCPKIQEKIKWSETFLGNFFGRFTLRYRLRIYETFKFISSQNPQGILWLNDYRSTERESFDPNIQKKKRKKLNA